VFERLARLGIFLGGFSLFLAVITAWILLLSAAEAPRSPPLANVAVPSRSIGETLVFYAPLGNELGLVLAGIAAFAFFIAVQMHQRRDQWLGSFRGIYGEFWGDDHVAYARSIIVSSTCYNEILRPILNKRNNNEENFLTLEENDILDKIDRFCAIMVRVTSFSSTLKKPDEFELWEKLFYDFWINKVEPREGLRTYIQNHWKELKPTRPKRPRRLFG
jgi:hypothetical protein